MSELCMETFSYNTLFFQQIMTPLRKGKAKKSQTKAVPGALQVKLRSII